MLSPSGWKLSKLATTSCKALSNIRFCARTIPQRQRRAATVGRCSAPSTFSLLLLFSMVLISLHPCRHILPLFCKFAPVWLLSLVPIRRHGAETASQRCCRPSRAFDFPISSIFQSLTSLSFSRRNVTSRGALPSSRKPSKTIPSTLAPVFPPSANTRPLRTSRAAKARSRISETMTVAPRLSKWLLRRYVREDIPFPQTRPRCYVQRLQNGGRFDYGAADCD